MEHPEQSPAAIATVPAMSRQVAIKNSHDICPAYIRIPADQVPLPPAESFSTVLPPVTTTSSSCRHPDPVLLKLTVIWASIVFS